MSRLFVALASAGLLAACTSTHVDTKTSEVSPSRSNAAGETPTETATPPAPEEPSSAPAGAATQPNSPDPAPSAASSVRRIREVWYDFQFSGQKIGYVKAVDWHTTVNRRPAYHLHRLSVLSVKRQIQTIDVQSSTDVWFALDGTPIRFSHERKEGGEQRKVEGYRDGDQIVLRLAVGRNLSEKKIPLTKDLRLASSLEVLLAEKLEVGAKMSGQVLDETQGDVMPYTTEVKSVDKVGVFTVLQTVGPIQAEVKIDREGTVLDVVLLNMNVRQRKVTQAEAVKQAPLVDLFSSGLFKMPRPLPPRDDIETLVIRLSSKRGSKVEVADDRRQRVKREGNAAELTIKVQDVPTGRVGRPIKGAQWAPFLQSTDYEPLDDEALRVTANRLVTDGNSLWEAAKAINAFVFRHIENKSLARAYASAPEALASREGDCTEHAVLFSALAKIAGIPTRLVTGLVYVGGPNNLFGYHEWVEIWTGKAWLAMDPTFGQDVADATHIKLYAGLSDAEGLRKAGQVAAMAIGDLELELVAYVDAKGKRRPL